MSNLQNELKGDIDKLLEKSFVDYAFAAKLFYPERFNRDFDPIHYNIFNFLEDNKEVNKIGIAAPRGIGKTSIINLLIPTLRIVFHESRYIVNVSATASMAISQSENLKQSLMRNPIIKYMFGDIKTKVFSKEQFVVQVDKHETCIMPRGAGQQVRGMLFDNYRPDYICIDDLENSEKVLSEDQRNKLKVWLYGDLLNCVDRGLSTWREVFLGTLLHPRALLLNLLESDNWKTLALEICDDNFKSNCPSFMDDDAIKSLYSDYEEQGLTHVFLREYRNKLSSGDDKMFEEENIKYYNDDYYTLSVSPDADNIVIIDPARTAERTKSQHAAVFIAIDLSKNQVYIRDVIAGDYSPDAFYDEVFEQMLILNVVALGVELTGLGDYGLLPINSRIQHYPRSCEIIKLHSPGGKGNDGAKDKRIASLRPFYRKGMINHNRDSEGVRKLKDQLLAFPNSGFKDIIDVTGYLSEMLEKGTRYFVFSPDYEPQADPNSYEYVDTIEEDMKYLEQQENRELNRLIEQYGKI